MARVRVVAPGRASEELASFGALALPDVAAVFVEEASPSTDMPTTMILDSIDRGALTETLARGFDRYIEWTGPADTADALRRATAGLVISLTTRSAHGALSGAVLSRALLARNVITAGMASKVSGATQEAIANAVLHGNLGLNPAGAEEDFDAFHRAIAARLTEPDVARRRVTVDISWTAAEVTIEIGDEGDGFEPPDADSMALTVAASGRGMTIMRSLASRIAFKDGGRRTVLGFACGS